MKRISTITIGENRGKPRIWIQGRYLEAAGFTRGTPIKIQFQKKGITITPFPESDNHVSGTANRAPIIDINTAKIIEAFEDTKNVKVAVYQNRITISRALHELIRERPATNTVFDAFPGVGLLSQSARESGLSTKGAVEKNPDYADVWQNNFSADMYNMDIADIDIDDLEEVDVLTAGIPCESFSHARQNGCQWYDHDNADLSMFLVPIIKKVKPKYIVLEEVPEFIDSIIGKLLVKALQRLHYTVDIRTLTGRDYGLPATRKRVVILASIDGKKIPEPVNENTSLADILLPVDHPECKWWNRNTKPWVFEHWEKQKAKGNNFRGQVIEYEKTEYVSTITRRYFAQRADNPLVKHPTIPDTYRWLTISEVKKIMGLPDDFYLGHSMTLAGEGMGQGVLVKMFKNIMKGVING